MCGGRQVPCGLSLRAEADGGGMKLSKKLISSILCLIASLACCVWACFAWFTQNKITKTGGTESSVIEDAILDFDVTAYYLNYSGESDTVFVPAGAGGVEAAYDINLSGTLEADDRMRPYGALSGESTAVLFVVSYSINSQSSQSFRITASCPDANAEIAVKGENNDFVSDLSNSVYFVTDVTRDASAGTYTAGNQTKAFLSYSDGSYGKSVTLSLVEGISVPAESAENSYRATAYFIMDYNADMFAYIYSLVLQQGGDLTSALSFIGDISIGIEAETGDGEEKDDTEPVTSASFVVPRSGADDIAAGGVVVSNELFTVETEADLIYKQIDNATRITAATLLDGSTVDFNAGLKQSDLTADGGTSPAIVFGANKDITLSVYLVICNDSYNSNRAGTFTVKTTHADGSEETETYSQGNRNVLTEMKFTLQAGDTVSVTATYVGNTFKLWLFGAEAELSA